MFMSAITVLKQNIPYGPFTRAEVAEQLGRGEITLDSLAFIDGLTQWTPLRDVLAKVDAAAVVPAPAPVATMPVGTDYGQTGPVSAGASAPIGTGYSYAATMQPPGHLVYAGFWLRFLAYVIDLVLLYAVVFTGSLLMGFVIGMVVVLVDRDALQSVLTIVKPVTVVITLVIFWLYFTLMESSRLQATVGKMALGLRVTNRQGERLGFGRATGRFFGKIVSALILYVGFMMAAWTERKQGLHDMLADTLVVRKPRA